MKKILLMVAVCLAVLPMKAQELKLRADNIEEIVAAMTLEEKATLVVGNGWGSMFEGFHMPFCKGHRVPGAAGETRAIPHLGIPSIILSDGPAGVRIKNDSATAFPVGIALASIADKELVYEVGKAIGEEAATFGIDVMLMPGMNLMRNPLCGRNYEYFSEDPVLSGEVATAVISGVQSAGVGTSVKHFALNNQETNRFHNDVQVDSVTLNDIYLENFRIAIQGAEPWTVMSSYNQVNGTPAQANRFLLQEKLREQWGYEGVALTDWTRHADPVSKVAAGTDLLMPGWKSRIGTLVSAVKHGKLSEERLNEAATRILQLIVKTHTFRADQVIPFSMEEHAALARRAGAAACVLLKNDNRLLPLGPSEEHSDKMPRVALYGAHSYSLLAGGTGSGYVNCHHRVPLSQGLAEAGIEVDTTLAKVYSRYMSRRISHLKSKGMSIVSKYMSQQAYREYNLPMDDIRLASYVSDVAIITIGRQAGEGGDRTLTKGDFYLTDDERALIENVCSAYHAFHKRVVVVLNVAGVIETASWRDLPDAILLAWCPGQEGGYAITDVLTGVVNPSGKLPVTFPMQYEDVPSAANFPLKKRGPSVKTTLYEEGEQVGHAYFDAHPEKTAYPFGFGLGY